MSRFLVAAACFLCGCSTTLIEKTDILDNRRVSGYRGIWFTLGQFSEYGDKYSGGLGTYTAKHRPLAIYAPEVEKTFFVYGGTTRKKETRLLCMIGYYDHENHSVPQPTVVVDKIDVIDPHDDPSLAIDGEGYLWVFVSGRSKKRPGFKYRSDFPYSIDSFTRITEEEMTYPQPLWNESKGFFHFFTKYTGVRELYFETSSDGFDWSSDTKLAGIIEPGATKSGHYQVSGQQGDIVCTFFNRHPDGVVDERTDLYYAQSSDWGRTWTTVEGKPLELPMTTVDCGARLIDYQSMGKNVYLKDLNFDENGYPVCLYVTSDGHEPGPKNGPRVWTVTRYDGNYWRTHRVCESDHNYDMGSLYINGSEWVVIGPTDPGPQLHQAGGEQVRWVSYDSGQTWRRKLVITRDSPRNHNYARRPENARNPFFSFWADGDPTTFSESRLYFCNEDGTKVYQLPYYMNKVSEVPVQLGHQSMEEEVINLTYQTLSLKGFLPFRDLSYSLFWQFDPQFLVCDIGQSFRAACFIVWQWRGENPDSRSLREEEDAIQQNVYDFLGVCPVSLYVCRRRQSQIALCTDHLAERKKLAGSMQGC